MLQFDPKSYKYRNVETGQYVSNNEVQRVITGEVNRLSVRLKGHARLLVSGKIDIAEFQTRAALSLKESHLRNAIVGAGGKSNVSSIVYGKVGAELKKQYGYLSGFGEAIAVGELSERQIIARAASYAASSRTSFYHAEFTSRGTLGFYAKRLLDPQSQHCESCINYQRLEWTLISLIVPPGVNCQCGGRCRCRLVIRKL